MKRISIDSINWDEIEIHPVCGIFPEMDAKTFEELKRSISEKGQLEPVVMNEAMTILYDGRHRLRALRESKLTTIDVVTFEELEHQFLEHGHLVKVGDYILDKNMRRRQLTSEQREQVSQALIEYYKKESAVNLAAGQAKAGRPKKHSLKENSPTDRLENSEDPRLRETRSKLAKAKGVSSRKAQRELVIAKDETLTNEVNNGTIKPITAEAIIVARNKGFPELEGDIRAGKLSLNKVKHLAKPNDKTSTYSLNLTAEEATHEFTQRVEDAWNRFVRLWDIEEWPEVMEIVLKCIEKKGVAKCRKRSE